MVVVIIGIISLIALGFALSRQIEYSKLRKTFETAGKQFAELERSERQARSHLTYLEAETKRLNDSLKQELSTKQTTKQKASAVEAETLQIKSNLERKLANTELQRDHILNRFEALELEVNVLKQELTTAREERDEFRLKIQSKKDQDVAQLKAEADDLKKTIKALSADLAQIKSKAVIDPQDYEKQKRRAYRNDQFYQSMRGLKDMAEERARNWEFALKSLSVWILEKSNVAKPNDPVLSLGIGPIVGEALERIGISLAEDSTLPENPEAVAANAPAVEVTIQ